MYHVWLFVDVLSANEPTLSGVALRYKTVGDPWFRLKLFVVFYWLLTAGRRCLDLSVTDSCVGPVNLKCVLNFGYATMERNPFSASRPVIPDYKPKKRKRKAVKTGKVPRSCLFSSIIYTSVGWHRSVRCVRHSLTSTPVSWTVFRQKSWNKVHKNFEIQWQIPKRQLNIAGIFCPAIDDAWVMSMRYILPLCFLFVS